MPDLDISDARALAYAMDSMSYNEREKRILALIAQERNRAPETVDRIEVIDDTGRAYVKGSIYGSPVTVKLDYQDDGRTLKVFVEPNHDRSDGHVRSECMERTTKEDR